MERSIREPCRSKTWPRRLTPISRAEKGFLAWVPSGAAPRGLGIFSFAPEKYGKPPLALGRQLPSQARRFILRPDTEPAGQVPERSSESSATGLAYARRPGGRHRKVVTDHAPTKRMVRSTA